MQVKINYEGKLQFKATARNHFIIGDQPEENGGEDKGMTPSEWLLASLGSCIGFYAVKYLQTRNIDSAGLCVTINADKSIKPVAHLDNFQVDVSLPNSLQTKHKLGLQQAIEACLIHNTLMHKPQITTHIITVPMLVK
jgi:putative redox protein